MTFDFGSPLPLCLPLGHDWYLSGVSNGEVTVYADHWACTRRDATCPERRDSSEKSNA